ncbi:MAG: GNAT family N-acetyltransferase [Myxococcales bacterium]|nr:GNAT family N-acetyltransferase [Myxococcales bacterium]
MSAAILHVPDEQRDRYLPGVLAVAASEQQRAQSQMIHHEAEFFTRYYGAGGDTCVAVLAGRVVAYALLATPERLHAIWTPRAARLGLERGRCGCVVQVAVAPEARRRGLATALLERLRDVARARGLAHLFATVAPDNVASVRTFERSGFRRFELATVYSEQVVRALFHGRLEPVESVQ